jgi:hypothetical protein
MVLMLLAKPTSVSLNVSDTHCWCVCVWHVCVCVGGGVSSSAGRMDVQALDSTAASQRQPDATQQESHVLVTATPHAPTWSATATSTWSDVADSTAAGWRAWLSRFSLCAQEGHTIQRGAGGVWLRAQALTARSWASVVTGAGCLLPQFFKHLSTASNPCHATALTTARTP